MLYVFRILAAAFSIYSLMCAARIVLTWIPGAAESGAGRFLCALCDPFLNLFRAGWLRFGAFDFSPLLALSVLTMASYVMQNLSAGARLSFASLLALVIQMAWSVVGSIIVFLIIVLAVRLIVFLTGADRSSSVWPQIDVHLNPFVYSITKFFSGGRPIAYKNALILAIVVVLLLRVGCEIVMRGLLRLCALIPF